MSSRDANFQNITKNINQIKPKTGKIYNSILDALVDVQLGRDADHLKSLPNHEKKAYEEKLKKNFREDLDELIAELGGED
ncbi:MAG: hypothetical protein ACFFC7_13160 [Candidatus Hermodarchaeota archaeon]